MHHGTVPDLHRNQPRLWNTDRGDLVERHMGPICLDMNRFQQARGRPAGAQTSKLLLLKLDRLLHPAFELVEIMNWSCHGGPQYVVRRDQPARLWSGTDPSLGDNR